MNDIRPKLELRSFLVHHLVLPQRLHGSLQLQLSGATFWPRQAHLQGHLPLFQILQREIQHVDTVTNKDWQMCLPKDFSSIGLFHRPCQRRWAQQRGSCCACHSRTWSAGCGSISRSPGRHLLSGEPSTVSSRSRRLSQLAFPSCPTHLTLWERMHVRMEDVRTCITYYPTYMTSQLHEISVCQHIYHNHNISFIHLFEGAFVHLTWR